MHDNQNTEISREEVEREYKNAGGEARFSRPALGPTHPPIKWVPFLFLGGTGAGRGVNHPPLSRAVTYIFSL
jgi:hypothetical protein